MILMIDNYDSFTYNLVQYLGEMGEELQVYRNDKITVEEIERLKPDRIVISPGPCTPEQAGISNEVIRYFGSKLPILGVCLGHQCIGYVYGAKVDRAGEIMHGKTSQIYHDDKGVLAGLPNPFEAIRLPHASNRLTCHSWYWSSGISSAYAEAIRCTKRGASFCIPDGLKESMRWL